MNESNMNGTPEKPHLVSDELRELLEKEWEKLRDEILARVGIQHSIIITATLTMGALGLAMATILDRGWYTALVLIGLFFFALAALYIEQDRLIARIGMYVNWEIRPALERLLKVQKGILGWETFRGQPLSRIEKAIATTLSGIRYLPSLGAGFTLIIVALVVRCPQWPNSWWEWLSLLVAVLVGVGLTYAAYLTHRDYNLIWDPAKKASAAMGEPSKEGDKSSETAPNESST